MHAFFYEYQTCFALFKVNNSILFDIRKGTGRVCGEWKHEY